MLLNVVVVLFNSILNNLDAEMEVMDVGDIDFDDDDFGQEISEEKTITPPPVKKEPIPTKSRYIHCYD